MEKKLKTVRRKAKTRRPHFKKNYFENQAWAQNQVICGLDEVGRGCLAGPLVTAAVILKPGTKISPLIKDSKKMTPDERQKAFKWIKKHCFYAVGIVHHRSVDEHNIWHATLISMKKSLVHLLAIAPMRPAAIVIDAMPLNLFDTSYKDIPVHHFPFGESKSSTIAAASIVAKVTRDALMDQLDQVFPSFALTQHKGYSTQLHKGTIKALGQQLIIHRQSFLKKIIVAMDSNDGQQNLFGSQ